MDRINTPLSRLQASILRLATGAVFGLIIAGLIETAKPSDVAIWRPICVSTLSLMAFVIWAGAGSIRRVSLAVWVALASLLVSYIAWSHLTDSADGPNFPFGQHFLIFPLLFIAHELVSSGDQAGKWIAPFETYFDEAWKRGVQLALAILFTALFWGILWLGAALLGFIGFKWLAELLANTYFAWPITGLAFGAAVHLGDVQTKLLANVRNLILGVLSWLLPVITLIGIIFAVSLALSGLAPLWATKAATATLLGGCVGFVLLINAAYQQGDEERQVPLVLKWSVRVAAILLLIFAVLAVWSLGLRISQYGLTSDRVFAGLGVVIALAYGLAYSAAVFLPGRWMGGLEPMNIGLAVFKCVLFIAILTPLATPDRLSVNDQVSRLNKGKVSVADFDWWLLKDDTGRYGKQALERLSGASDSRIATKAQAALDDKIGLRPFRTNFDDEDGSEKRNIEKPNLALLPVVFPKGASLPKSFVDQDFSTASNFGGPVCLQEKIEAISSDVCKVALLDLNKDGQPEVLVRFSGYLYLFTLADGKWNGGGMSSYLGANQAEFDAGKLRIVPPVLSDVLIGETRRIGFNNYPQEGDLAVASEPVNAIKDPPAPRAPPK